MVEYGISRFRGLNKDGSRYVEADEPLAILGLISFLGKEGWSLERHLMEPLNGPHASARGFAFESFGAYILARAFAKPRRLAEVFNFVGECSLGDEVAELVTLQKDGATFICQPLDITSDVRPNHILGDSQSKNAETLEWLRDPKGTAFCFPAQNVGPDLILTLRLAKDSTILRVCIQFKHQQELNLAGTQGAIRTTEPYNFPMPDMRTAIQQLGTGTRQAGDCGVLRVLVSHPASPHIDALIAASRESHDHPVATVNIQNLALPESSVGQMLLSLAKQRVAHSRKRGRDAFVSVESETGRMDVDVDVDGASRDEDVDPASTRRTRSQKKARKTRK